jgi:hypothetical protein
MTRELVDRMRTCAAAIEASQTSGNPWDLALLGNDASRLLRIAADALDAPEPLGEPMELLPAAPPPKQADPTPPPVAVWGGDLPPVKPRHCPSCLAVGALGVNRVNGKIRLTCQSCAYSWEYL